MLAGVRNARMNPAVLHLHAENAAFLAAQRRRAIDGPRYRLIDLYDLEQRLSGHLDALYLLGDAGAEAAAVGLEEPGYGEIFVAACTAFRRGDAIEIDRLTALAVDAEVAEALSAAAAWCAPAVVARHVRRFIQSANPAEVVLALNTCGLRRFDPSTFLTDLLGVSDPVVRAHAARLAGEIGRSDLLPLLLRLLDAENSEEAFWSAWAAILLGDRQAAVESLAARLVSSLPASAARRGAELLPLVMPPAPARALVHDLLVRPSTERWGLVAVGAFGEAETLDWLLRQMARPDISRLAGASFCLITGARLGPDHLELDVFPEEPESSTVEDPQEAFIESSLYWPDPDKLGCWLATSRDLFRPGTRHLLGQAAWTHGEPSGDLARYQPDYRALAFELATRRPEAPLPNWQAPVMLAGANFTRNW